MNPQLHTQLVAALNLPYGASFNLEALEKNFPTSVKLETLISIYSQESQQKVIKSNHHHKARIQEYCARYIHGDEDILSLCMMADFPPCVMMRRMLEAMELISRQSISDVLKNPQSLTDMSIKNNTIATKPVLDRLRNDLIRCVKADPCYSPLSDLAKHAAGLEFELRLNRNLFDIGVTYWTEKDLREKGFFKTPDVWLHVPMSMRDSNKGNW